MAKKKKVDYVEERYLNFIKCNIQDQIILRDNGQPVDKESVDTMEQLLKSGELSGVFEWVNNHKKYLKNYVNPFLVDSRSMMFDGLLVEINKKLGKDVAELIKELEKTYRGEENGETVE